jgi:phosphonate transport system substrate-binding protein
MKKLIASIIVFLSFTIHSKEKLRISTIPDESINELHKKFLPLVEYLEKETNLEIEFTPVTDYAAVVEALVSKKIDMAWLGGFTFVQAYKRSKGNIIPIIQRERDKKFKSVFITNKDSNIKNLVDLENKTFSFGSPSSTSGHLMPRYFLMEENIIPEKFFNKIAYSGAHDATIFSVLGKKVDAGALNISVWENFKKKNLKIKNNLNVFFTTPDYFDYNWSIRSDLPKSTREKITNAFLKLDKNNANHKEILKLQRAEKYITTNKLNYLKIKDAAIKSNLLN